MDCPVNLTSLPAATLTSNTSVTSRAPGSPRSSPSALPTLLYHLSKRPPLLPKWLPKGPDASLGSALTPRSTLSPPSLIRCHRRDFLTTWTSQNPSKSLQKWGLRGRKASRQEPSHVLSGVSASPFPMSPSLPRLRPSSLFPLSNGHCWLKQNRPQGDPPHPPQGQTQGLSRELRVPSWKGGRVKVTKVTYPGGRGRSEEGEASSWEQGR